MGCTASKLDNEDTVRRCKERRRLMKEAVFARHLLAAAHADYCRSLRVTGAALVTFAAGEPLSVCDQTPAVLLRTASSLSRSTNPPLPRHPSPSPSSIRPPPPPPPPFSPSPSPTIASSKIPHILSASSIQTDRRKKPPKLPHILSESSLASSPGREPAGQYNKYPGAFTGNSTYSDTPSQASSVWNWENFYPPSPPDSEYFQRLKKDSVPNHHHLDEDYEEETEREEVQCSEYGDHCSTTSSDSKSDNEDVEDGDSRSEVGTQSNFGSSFHNESFAPPSKYKPATKSEKSDDAGSSVSWKAGLNETSEMNIVVRHRDLAEIASSIKEYFDKAADAGNQVSEMLETNRAQLDRSFRQLKSNLNNLEFQFEVIRHF